MSAQNQDGNNEQKRCSKALKAVKVEEKPKEEWAEDLEAKFLRQEGYEIKGKLGQGGSGKVYKGAGTNAEDQKSPSKSLTAIKVAQFNSFLKELKNLDTGLLFLKEVKILNSLYSSSNGKPEKYNVMSIVDSFEGSYSKIKMYTIITPLYNKNGTSVEDRLNKAKNGRFPIDKVSIIVWQILVALKFLERCKIVHRDLKPANLVFKSNNKDKWDIVLIDLGMALNIGEVPKTDEYCGLIEYRAPEIHLAQKNKVSYDYSKTDIWSLGIIIYELLTGDSPFAQVGNSNEMIAENIIKGKVSYNQLVWDKCPAVKAFVKKLFTPNPYSRPNAKKALELEWMRPYQPEKKKVKQEKK